MHAYLSGIGFSHFKSGQAIDSLAREVEEHYNSRNVFHTEDGRELVQYSKAYAKDSGLMVIGENDSYEQFHRQYIRPYYCGRQISLTEEMSIEPETDKDSYEGACDDSRIGITIIFSLTNMSDLLTLLEKRKLKAGRKPVILSGIVMDGLILLPVQHSQKAEKIRRQNTREKNDLLNAARNGDEEAMENLTINEMDTYSMLSRRLLDEDILTIVETYFMPCGVECDQYNILGIIQSVEMTENNKTGEVLCQMVVSCNDVNINLCANVKDLMGVPEVGRRFKGRIWLQGEVLFDSGTAG